MDNYPVRKQIRLKNYDYSSCGYYFVTICTNGKRKVFGEIEEPQLNKVRLSRIGLIVKNIFNRSVRITQM